MNYRRKVRVWKRKLNRYIYWTIGLDEYQPAITDDDTLQFSILFTDKNNKLLYEGDIVKYDGINYEIKYLATQAGYILHNQGFNFITFSDLTGNELEWLGTSKESPELLWED